MRAHMRWLPLLAVAWICRSDPANACETSEPSLHDLLSRGRFEQAESVAKNRLTASPDSLAAHVALASVYAQWASREEVSIDTEALGFAPGETGSKPFTPEQFDRGMRAEIRLDPAKAARATEILEGVVRRWPDHWDSRMCLLELRQVGEEHEKLLADLTRTAQHFRSGGADTVDRLLRFGKYHYDRREFDRARDVMQTLLAAFPNSAPLLSSLGVVLIETEELEKSLALFQRAHELARDDALVVRNLATDAMYLGRLEDAGKALEKLHELQPDQTRVLFELAIVATATKPEGASPAWTRYLDRHAIRPDAEDWAAFARSTSTALAAKADDGSLLHMAQAVSGAAGYLELALLHGLARRHPDDPAIPFMMGQAYEREELPKRAYDAVLRAEKRMVHPRPLLTIPPHSLRFEAGRLALKLDRYPESIRYLTAVESEAPETGNLQYLLGLAHGRAGHRDEALRYYRKCLELPNNAQYASYCQHNLASSAAAADQR
jgi:tetratricopeptide (TPR) repeat protein